MEKYKMFVSNGHIWLLETIDNKKSSYLDKKALKVFNKLLSKELKDNKEVLTSEDGLDRYVKKDDFEIEFKNYEKLMKSAEKLGMDEKMKKQFALGATAATTAIAGIAIGSVLTAGKVQGMESGGFTDIAEPIRVEQEANIDAEVAPETTSTILETELTNDGMVYASVDDYIYTGETFASSATLSTVYLDTNSNYDERLEANVSRLDNVINMVSNRWGVSPQLIRDIMKQESHGGTLDNKMQIVFSSWHDQIIKVYNFETNRYETMVLTNTPGNYHNVNYVITREQLTSNAETNINAGVMIMSYLYNKFDHNLPVSVQAYNFGNGAMNQVIRAAAAQQGITVEQYLSDESNTSFMELNAIVRPHYGDPAYTYHVMSMSTPNFNLDNGKEYVMRYLDEAGNVVERTTFIRSSYTLDLEATVGAGSNLHM